MSKVLAAVAVVAFASGASAQSFHQSSDGTVDFSKSAFADTSDPANWDTITSTVAITRGNVQGIYNPIAESSYIEDQSPTGTLWLFGNTVQDVLDGTVDLMDFNDWETAHSASPPSTVGVDSVLYLIAEDAYVDIRFTQWAIGAGGGGAFSYTRAIIPTPSGAALLGVTALGAVRRKRR